jgi:medium-chain acyl-[acyl-carrier-protein] hydrolase
VPFAGGGASAFRAWPDHLPPAIEVLAIELPGRETRFSDPLIPRRGALITALADAVGPALAPPYALYGHSAGALVAFELARELRRRGAPGPVHLFASGRRAPHVSEPDPMYQLSDAQLVARLRLLGGTSEAVLREPELMAVYLPILRADLAVNEADPIATEPPLPCPITAQGATADPEVSPEALLEWRAHTAGVFERELYPGDHFFMQAAPGPVLKAIAGRLLPLTGL